MEFTIAWYFRTRLRDLNLTRGDLGKKISCNPTKALRRLDHFLATLEAHEEFLEKLKSAILADPETWNQCLEEDRRKLQEVREEERLQELEMERIQKEREKENFRPHIWIKGEWNIPSPIFVVAWFGESIFLRADLPEYISDLEPDIQIEMVRERFKAFFAKNEGRCGPFGAIIGFYYRKKWDLALEFDVEGNRVGEMKGEFPMGRCCLTHKGKEVPVKAIAKQIESPKPSSEVHEQ